MDGRPTKMAEEGEQPKLTRLPGLKTNPELGKKSLSCKDWVN